MARKFSNEYEPLRQDTAGQDEEAASSRSPRIAWRGFNFNFRFRQRLEASGSVQEMTWGSALTYATAGVGVCILLPGLFQLGYMLYRHSQSTICLERPHGRCEKWHFHINSALYEPYGVGVGCVFSFLFFFFELRTNSKWQKALHGFFRSTAADLGMAPCWAWLAGRCCGKKGREEADEKKKRDAQNPVRRWMKKHAVFLIGVAVFPIVAWYAPLAWWAAAADRYRECKCACQELELMGNSTGKCKGMDMLDFEHEAEEDCDELPRRPGNETMQECLKILRTETASNYTRGMLHEHHHFLAFEALLRHHYHVNSVDLYGGLLGCVFIAAIAGVKMGLREKVLSLASFKQQFLSDHMGDKAREYADYFSWLDKLQGRENSWTTVVLKQAVEQVTNERSQSEHEVLGASRPSQDRVLNYSTTLDKIMQSVRDENLNDIVDDAEVVWKDMEQLKYVFGALVASSLYALTPCLCRYFRSMGQEGLFSRERFLPIVAWNTWMTFLAFFGIYCFLTNAYVRHQSQKEKVVAFDCLWRFPGEHPLKSVMKDGKPLLEHLPKKEERPPSSEIDDAGQYMADFTATSVKGLQMLQYWFVMRQYIQLDKTDERISIEVASGAALATLLPAATAVVFNLLVLDNTQWKLEPANFQLALGMVYVAFMIINSLVVTLGLNDVFEHHRDQLLSVRAHIKIQKVKDGQWDKETFLNLEPEVVTVQTFLDSIDAFESPATMFGITVHRKLIAGLATAATLSILPQAVCIAKSFFKEILDSA